MKYYPVASTSELSDIAQIHIKLNDEEILLCRDGEDYFAVSYYCSHEIFPLEGGSIANRCITCPYHGAEFSLETGEAMAPPAWEDIKIYPTSVEKGIISIGSVDWPDSMKLH